MRVDPARAQALISQLSSVKNRIDALANGRNVCQSRLHNKKLLHLHQDNPTHLQIKVYHWTILTSKVDQTRRRFQTKARK